LLQYSEALAARPRQYAFNKADIPENRRRYGTLENRLPEPTYCISAATGEGTRPLLEALWRTVESARRTEQTTATIAPQREYAFIPPFEIKATGTGFRIVGDKPLQAVSMTNFENEEAVMHLQRRLEKMGVFKALKRMGAHTGQPIFIGDQEMEYRE